MGKNKLERWRELGTFNNVIQAEEVNFSGIDHRFKGSWRKEVFLNENPITLELACGKGEYTTGLSGIFPGKNFIGVDIKGARMWRGAKTAGEEKFPNAAFLRTRIEFIDGFFAPDEVDEIWIVFPDPHPGGKNSKKRLTSPWFLNKYRTFLKSNGIIHLKTDNAELYNFTRRIVTENTLEIIISTDDLYGFYQIKMNLFRNIYVPAAEEGKAGDMTDRILSIRTFYENMFLNEGMKICYLAFRLDSGKIINDETRKRIFR